jgi:hypothetical protein
MRQTQNIKRWLPAGASHPSGGRVSCNNILLFLLKVPQCGISTWLLRLSHPAAEVSSGQRN